MIAPRIVKYRPSRMASGEMESFFFCPPVIRATQKQCYHQAFFQVVPSGRAN
jgi:hypothetical protein